MSKEKKVASEKLQGIGQRLRVIRERQGYTQDQMAELLEISKSHYGLVERGQNALSLSKILHLYDVLKIDISYLLVGVSSPVIDLADIINDCPENKRDDMIQLIKHARNLCRN